MAIVTISVNKQELQEKKEHVVMVGKATVRRLEEGGIKVVDFIHKFSIGFNYVHGRKA